MAEYDRIQKKQLSRAVAHNGGGNKKLKGFVDKRHQTMSQFKIINTVQLRSDKRITDSARVHYNDAQNWGAKYGIQSDTALLSRVPNSVRGYGEIPLGIFEYSRFYKSGVLYKKGKRCQIIYDDRKEGWGKYEKKYTSIFHCGPSGPILVKPV